MIVPYQHTASFVELDEATTVELSQMAKRAIQALDEEYHPDGHNVGMNLGQAAGAGIAQHLHLHVVPRWFGDANFVSVIGETRVLPEELSVTRERLSRRFK
jgi:ATP adenylyltransferase